MVRLTRYGSLEAERGALQEDLEKAQDALVSAETNLSEATANRSSLQDQVSTLQTGISTLQTGISGYAKVLSGANDAREEAELRLAQVEGDNAEIEKARKALIAEKEELQQRHAALGELKTAWDAERVELHGKIGESEELRSGLEELRAGREADARVWQSERQASLPESRED